MLLSHLLMRHKTPEPRFLPSVFMGLVLIFTIMGQSKPLVGLVGLGTVLIISAVLVEANRARIWAKYCKSYRKVKGLGGLWTKPNKVYYMINVMFLWPFIIFLGFICLWAAYRLA